jgi:hypothetical protein
MLLGSQQQPAAIATHYHYPVKMGENTGLNTVKPATETF